MIDTVDFYRLMQGSKDTPVTRLATIDPAYVSGNPKVIFDGESVPTTKTYRVLKGYGPAAGDRVVMLASGRTWVVLSAVQDTPAKIDVGAGARFTESTGQSVASGVVAQIGWNAEDYSYGLAAERPSIASTGSITLPPGVWNISDYVNLSGSGAVTRFQNSLRVNGVPIAVNEYPINTGTSQGTVNTTYRTLVNVTITVEAFQNSGNTKTVNSTSNLSIDRLAVV